MLKTILGAVIAITTTTVTVQAAPTVIYDGGTGYAIGIQNLDVNATLYNVDFVGGSYDTVFAVDAPYFFGDEPGSDAAADAIMNALNGETSVPQISGSISEILWVPFEFNALNPSNFRTKQTGHNTLADPWQRFATFSGSRADDFSGPPNSWLFATFTPVPEPASLALLGLGALALIRRR